MKHAKSGTFHWQNRRSARNGVFLLLGMSPPFEDHSTPRRRGLVLEWRGHQHAQVGTLVVSGGEGVGRHETRPIWGHILCLPGGRGGEPAEHHERAQLGTFVVFWWNKSSQTRKHVPHGTRFRVWLEGGWGGWRRTSQTQKTHPVGHVFIFGWSGGTAGGRGWVLAHMYNVIIIKKQTFCEDGHDGPSPPSSHIGKLQCTVLTGHRTVTV